MYLRKKIKKAETSKRGMKNGLFTLRLRIALLVIIFTLAPLFVQLFTSLKSSTNNIMNNTQMLNESVNNSLREKFESYITNTVKIIDTLPKAADIFALNPFDQERALRKLAAAEQCIKQIHLADAEGNMIFTTDTLSKGINVSQEIWFMEAMKGKQYISDSSFDKISRIPVFLISAPITGLDQNLNGVICAQISFNSIQYVCQNSKTGETGHTYIVDKNGAVLSHYNFEDMVLDGYNAVTGMIEGAIKVVRGETGTSYYENIDGKKVMGTYSIIPSTGWGIISEIEVWEVMQPVEKEKSRYAIIAIISFIAASIASFWLASMITKPIIKMAAIAGEYKQGVLTNRIKVKSKDEIGRLQESFNAMADSLTDILKRVNDAVIEINNYSQNLSENAGISAASIEEISAISETAADGSKTQIESIHETFDIANEVTQHVEKVYQNTKNAADSAKETANIAQEGTNSINIINEKMEIIKNNVGDSAQLVENLGAKSSEVTGIVNIIHDIADRTNMLALNAAIEAARAGEAGRGFSVVAEEVRKLADQTKEASLDIEVLLEEIQGETLKTVDAMNSGLKDVEQSTEAIKTAYGTFESIISKVESVADEVIGVSSLVYRLRDDMGRIVSALDKVSQISISTSEGTQNILASTEEQSSALQEINESATKLTDMAQALQEIVGRFRL